MITIIAFLILLGVLVVIHEGGHFFVLRMCKVHVDRFSVGMGPVIYKKKDKKGTEFALSALPLGGYVSYLSKKALDAEPEMKKNFTACTIFLLGEELMSYPKRMHLFMFLVIQEGKRCTRCMTGSDLRYQYLFMESIDI